jgi:hypothetical protein
MYAAIERKVRAGAIERNSRGAECEIDGWGGLGRGVTTVAHYAIDLQWGRVWAGWRALWTRRVQLVRKEGRDVSS